MGRMASGGICVAHASSKEPEIPRLIKELHEQISYLEESFGELNQKCASIMVCEPPSTASAIDESLYQTALGEQLVGAAQRIRRVRMMINETRARIEL